jgi:hypothetical protein
MKIFLITIICFFITIYAFGVDDPIYPGERAYRLTDLIKKGDECLKFSELEKCSSEFKAIYIQQANVYYLRALLEVELLRDYYYD